MRLRATVVTVDVAMPTDRRDEDQLRFHRLSLADNEVTRRDGLRVTTIERTLFDIAATGADIRKLAQEALAKRLTTLAKLRRWRRDHKGERGAPAMRQVAGEPHTRSDLERRFLRFLADNGFPPPVRTTRIGPYTVDATGRSSGSSSRSTRTPTSRHLRGGPRAGPVPGRAGLARCASPKTA